MSSIKNIGTVCFILLVIVVLKTDTMKNYNVKFTQIKCMNENEAYVKKIECSKKAINRTTHLISVFGYVREGYVLEKIWVI